MKWYNYFMKQIGTFLKVKTYNYNKSQYQKELECLPTSDSLSKGILISNKKEWNIDICSNINELQNPYAE